MDKHNGLTRQKAKEQAQELADETGQYCLIYREESGDTFGVVPDDGSWGWQVRAAVECVWPKEA